MASDALSRTAYGAWLGALGAGLMLGVGAAPAGLSDDVRDEAARILADASASSQARSGALVALGDDVAAPLVEWLSTCPPQADEEHERIAAILALKRLDGPRVSAAVRASVASDLGRQGRVSLLRVIRHADTSTSMVDIALELASDAQGDPMFALTLGEELRLTVAAVLRRSPGHGMQMLEWIRRAGPQCFHPLLEASVELPDSELLPVLSSLVERQPEQIPALLPKLERVLRSSWRTPTGHIAPRLRPLLNSASTRTTVGTIHVLSLLDDCESIGDIIEFLDDPRDGVSAAAHSALQEMTGLRLPAARQRWARWHLEESTWREHAMGEVLARLRSGALPRVVSAIQALERRRLHRRELTELLTPFLYDPNPTVAVLACRAVGNLACPIAVDALIECLDGPEVVVLAAHTALERITGADLPADRSCWLEFVDRRRSH